MTERTIYHFLLGFILLFCVACSSSNGQEPVSQNIAGDELVDEAVFHATVVEVENGLMVTPLDGEAESKSSDLITVGTNDAVLFDREGNNISLSDFEVGNTVEIIYDGNIMESYPAQINSNQVKIMEDE